MTHICIGVVENCDNPESYGMICVKCNKCKRFDYNYTYCKRQKRQHKAEDETEYRTGLCMVCGERLRVLLYPQGKARKKIKRKVCYGKGKHSKKGKV